MFEEKAPTVGSLTCPECGEVVPVEISLDLETAEGVCRCSEGHELFSFEADTLGRLVGASGE